MLCMALDEEAKRDGHASVDLCLAGVSLGGTMSALTALAMAKARGDASRTTSSSVVLPPRTIARRTSKEASKLD